jgi:hypothetical protein
MMGIIQMFTEQDMRPFHGTLFNTVKGGTTYETMTSAEE